MQAFVKLGFVASFVCVQACAKSDGDAAATAKFQGAAYATIGESQLTASETALSGTGKIVFEAPLGGVEEGAHFDATFALEDGGEARLVTFAGNDLGGGLEIVVTRAGAALQGRLMHGDAATDLSKVFEGIDAAQPVTFKADVHNDEKPAHILVWSGTETSFGEEQALFNSEDGGAAPGNGVGAFWGIALKNATVSAATMSAPKFEEE